MKRILLILFASVGGIGISWAAHQAAAPAGPSLASFVPAGAMLYLEAKDFSSLLADWNGSPQKQQWVKSDNYEVFSRSRLFLRLKEASDQFAVAAGLPPDMKFLTQVAGKQSALALYDIGKLQFLYITKLDSGSSAQTMLWQTRAKFETRNAGGTTFYFRSDPQSEREVAFAANNGYLLLTTREDLMAGALQLLAGSKDRAVESEEWWSQPVHSAGAPGDLRMVLNLERIVPSPYFRSYWVQQNITEMKQYSAAISDLYRSSKEYREERVLLKKAAPAETALTLEGAAGVADLVRLVPSSAGIYEAKAAPSTNDCLQLLEVKILAPHLGPPAVSQIAPEVQLTSGTTGDASDLETRIDQAPVYATTAKDSSAALAELLNKNPVQAVLQTQSTERDKDGVFVRIHAAVALLAEADWNEKAAQSALTEFAGPGLTAGRLGVEWQPKSGYQELDGLWTLAAAVRGKYLIVSDDPALLSGILANVNQKTTLKPAIFVGGFHHARERESFGRLTGLLDGRIGNVPTVQGAENTPQFMSGNIRSFSSAFAGVSAEKIVVRDAAAKVQQTVTYEWSE